MILLLLMMLFGRESKAQAAEGCGTSYWDAIPVAFSVGKATFTDVRDTSTGPPWYYTCFYISGEGGTYKYTNAVFHRAGLGFRGFRKIETEDVVNGRTMASVFDPELLSTEVRKDYDNRYLPVRKTSLVNGNIASQEHYEYDDRQQLTRKEQCSYDSENWLVKTFEYNRDGILCLWRFDRYNY